MEMAAAQKHPFQVWIEENDVCDVRFFPANNVTSTPSELLDEAMRAISAYEEGKTVPYSDNVEEHELEHHAN